MRLLYKFASRSRPNKFFACLDNIFEMAAHSDFLILASLDIDDKTMANPQVRDRIRSYGDKLVALYGTSENKVDAINRDITLVPKWDVLLNHSDDMWLSQKGLDVSVVEHMRAHFPDTDGFLHYPDHKVKEKICTYSIMGRKYYERTGYVYHPEYKSVYCDNEATDVAKMLGKYLYVPEFYIEHKHPAWGFGKVDDLMRHTESFYHQDHATYEKRKKIKFGLR